MYLASARYHTRQHNQHIPPIMAYQFHRPPHSYYMENMPTHVYINALPESTTSARPFQPPEIPIQRQKRKREANEKQKPKRRPTDTPIRPLKGRVLQARVGYMDGETT